MANLNNYINEIKKLFLLALPLMLIQVFNSGKGIVDTMMVGNIDKLNLAGLSLAVGLYIVIMLFSAGVATANIALYSKLRAKKQIDKIKYHAQQNLYLNIIISIVISLILINCGVIFDSLGNLQQETRQIATDYLIVMGYIFPVANLLFLFRPLMQAFIKNKFLLFVSGMIFFLNIPLNYFFIYNLELRAIGSAYSTAICFMLEALIVFGYVFKHKDMNFFSNFSKVDFSVIKKSFLIGLPIGLAIMVEVSLYTAITFLLAKYGEEAVGAHHLATNYLGFIFMFSLGLSFALTQRVSHFLGLKQYEEIKTVVLSATALSLMVNVFTICITLILKEQIAMLYTSNIYIIAIAANMLLISCVYQAFDGLKVVSSGILRAYKLNRQAFNYSLLSYWLVGFGAGYVLSLEYGYYGFWYGFIFCYVIAALLFYRKVYTTVWKS